MDKKAKNTMIVSVIALALVLIGVTYAYFSARITGLESASTISLTAGRMGIVYSEDDADVSVNNIYPREEAWITKQITLTGYNTTDQDMRYDLGINIISNTFKRGELTFDLTGVGTNGTKISDITGKSLLKTSGFFKLGTGSFNQANGDTHVYILKIYFKDTGEDQNYNQEAAFSAKLDVRETGVNIAGVNRNQALKKCTTDGYVAGDPIADGTTYSPTNSIYTYTYLDYYSGWNVTLKDKNSTSPITEAPCTHVNDVAVNSYSNLFDESKATSIDLSGFNSSYVTDMSYMFRDTAALTLDLRPLDTSNVTGMSSMFNNSKATSINLTGFDTSKVTMMIEMFSYSEATTLDLSSFDTSNVSSIEQMFASSNATQIIGLDTFDISSLGDLMMVFYQCRAEVLDLSSWDTSRISSSGMYNLFSDAYATTGYARTQADADKFNSLGEFFIPNQLRFVVKQ